MDRPLRTVRGRSDDASHFPCEEPTAAADDALQHTSVRDRERERQSKSKSRAMRAREQASERGERGESESEAATQRSESIEGGGHET